MLRLLIAILIFSIASLHSPAQKKRTIKSVQTEQQAAQKKIKETKKKISANTAQTEKELSKLSLIRGEISQKEQQISVTRNKLDSLNALISHAQGQIDSLDNRRTHLRNAYTKELRKLQGTQHHLSPLSYIFAAGSFQEAYSRIRYVQEFSNWRKRKTQEISELSAKIELQRNDLAGLQSEQSTSLSALNSDQAILKAKQDESNRMVTKLRRDGKNLKIALDKEQKRLKKIDNEITRMIEAERREREKQKHQKEKKSPKEQKDSSKKSGGKTPKPKSEIDNSDPDEAMTAKFANNKGTMIFPVTSPYRMVAKFGSSNGQINNTGIEMVLDGSDGVRCVFEGTVSRIFQSSDGNYSIMVRHGAYITVYYHIAIPSVKAKAKVKAGQTLGRAAIDGRYDKPLLHFEVRHGSTALNPLEWVK